MIDGIYNGFSEFFNIYSFIYLNLGLFLGLIFGSIPGLTVMLCLVLFLPFTYSLDVISSLMFLLGIYCAGSYGGSISAILINTPGTPHAAATMLDGHPLSKNGKTLIALNTALYSSVFGGIFSALVLLFFAPKIATFALSFGPPEYFLLCVFGLLIISGVSSGNILNGFISACFGLIVSTVGMDSISGTFRFTFGNFNLYSGMNLVVVLIGLFAISEVMRNTVNGFKLTGDLLSKDYRNENDLTFKSFYKVKKTLIRSSIVGTFIGCIPGTGASMASFLSYDLARRNSDRKSDFGKGSVEGVAAAESANNAVTGATLIPLLTLGIPGDAAVAILLGTLMINGLTPGPNLFEEHGNTVYAVMIGLIFINIFMLLQGRILMRFFSKISLIDMSILTPLIVVFCFSGAYSISNSMFDVYLCVVFGFLSFFLIKINFSPIPILLGLVLGPITEMNFRRSMTLSDGGLEVFYMRPISLSLLVVLFLVVLFLLYKVKFNGFKRHVGKGN